MKALVTGLTWNMTEMVPGWLKKLRSSEVREQGLLGIDTHSSDTTTHLGTHSLPPGDRRWILGGDYGLDHSFCA